MLFRSDENCCKWIFLNFKYLPIHDKLVVDCGIDIQ